MNHTYKVGDYVYIRECYHEEVSGVFSPCAGWVDEMKHLAGKKIQLIGKLPRYNFFTIRENGYNYSPCMFVPVKKDRELLGHKPDITITIDHNKIQSIL